MSLFKGSEDVALYAQSAVTFADLHAILTKISESEGQPLFTPPVAQQTAPVHSEPEPAEVETLPEADQKNFSEEITEAVVEQVVAQVAAEPEEQPEAVQEV